MNRRCAGAFALAVLCLSGYTGNAAQFSSAASGSCMHVPEHEGFASDGTQVRLRHCEGIANQNWTVTNGQIIASFGSCLDIMGSAANDGARVIVVACNGRPSQQWTLSNGQIVGLGGKCIDVRGGSTEDGSPLILAACRSSPSQQWSLQ